MKRKHAMPFGAELIDGGGVRFRLWAPGVDAVGLKLDEAGELPMLTAGQGWFELSHQTAHAGSCWFPTPLRVPILTTCMAPPK